MNHFFDAPKMELIVWGSTMGIFAFSAFRFRSQFKIARSEAGDTKPGSTGPRTNLDASRTIGTFFYVCSPAVRLLGGYCKQQISPAGVDDKVCSPITTRCLWN